MIRLLHGDCRNILPTLDAGSVQCIVTSPPYWALRSYLPADHPDKAREIGGEPTVEAWIDTMVDVLRACRRVLRDDGVMFLNLGDSYAGNRGAAWGPSPRATEARSMTASRRRDDTPIPRSDLRVDGVRPKEMVGQPWRLALALRAGWAACSGCQLERRADLWPVHLGERVCIDCLLAGRLACVVPTEPGWYLRSEIIWSKPNPMPESVRDRPTKAHEHVFLLSKGPKYFWNFVASQEPVTGNAHPRVPTPAGWNTAEGAHGSIHPDGRRVYAGNGVGFGHGFDAAAKPRHDSAAARRARASMSVKSAPDERRNGIRPAGVNPKAAQASSAVDGAYADGKSERLGRGAGWREAKQNASFSAPVTGTVETRNARTVWEIPTHPFRGAHFATFPPELARRCIAAGSRPGDTVLDPFGGAGTVGLVAERLQRHAVLIDLDARNVPMARERIAGEAPLLTEIAA